MLTPYEVDIVEHYYIGQGELCEQCGELPGSPVHTPQYLELKTQPGTDNEELKQALEHAFEEDPPNRTKKGR